MTMSGWQRALVGAGAVATVVGGAVLATRPWGSDEAAGDPVEHRACNVVFQVPPDSSEFEIIPIAMWPANDGKPSLIVRMKQPRIITDPQTGEVTDQTLGVLMDAETGEILSEAYYTPSDEALLRDVLATIRVEPFDPTTAPWPYSDATTGAVNRQKVPPNGGVEIRSPDAGSGLVLSVVSGDSDLSAIDVNSCKSAMRVDLKSGALLKQDIHPDDAAAFETFRAAVEAGAR